MKKNYLKQRQINIENNFENKSANLEIKTTDINILLNRVKLQKKKSLNNKIIFSLFVITVISALSILLNFSA